MIKIVLELEDDSTDDDIGLIISRAFSSGKAKEYWVYWNTDEGEDWKPMCFVTKSGKNHDICDNPEGMWHIDEKYEPCASCPYRDMSKL